MNQALGFAVVIEHGDLESKTTLLIESIRRLPSLRDCPIYVVQPRRGALPSRTSLRVLAQNDAWFVFADLNRTWQHHNLMNKAYAAALVESLVEHTVETLVFLDSDVMFIAEPDGLALAGKEMVAIVPVAQWDVGKVGQLVDEPLTPYWRLIYEVCGATALPNWHVTTTIDCRRMLPYFNSGVVAVRPARAIFRHWRENVERLAQDERARSVPDDKREFFFLEQAMLSGTLLAQLSREQIRILDQRYNYPIHAHHLLPDGIRASTIEDISILHYHGHFSNLYWMDDINVSEPLASWLLSRLPFRPQLRLTRSTAALLTSYLLSRFPLRHYHHHVVSRIPGLCRTVPHPGRH